MFMLIHAIRPCAVVQDCADDVSLCTAIDGVGTAYCGGTRFTQTFTISHRCDIVRQLYCIGVDVVNHVGSERQRLGGADNAMLLKEASLVR